MSTTDLQARFEAALRRALVGTTEASAPATVNVDVSAPNVIVTPTIEATLPALQGPLPVVDVQRFGGAFECEIKVDRTSEGFIKSARLVPTIFHPFVVENAP